MGFIQRDTVGEIIRQAERHIDSREFTRAQDCLAEAWRLSPGNPYIPAIVERMEILQSLMRHDSTRRYDASDPVRYLALSVGNQFAGEIRPASAISGTVSPEELSAKVRRLTMVALSLLERGSVESAFQILMKAYVVDPVSPEIISCANKILPVWEALRLRRNTPQSSPAPRRSDDGGAAAALAQKIVREGDSSLPTEAHSVAGSAEQRILALKQQREQERRARERKMWRAASKVPSTAPPATAGASGADGSCRNAPEEKRGFLTSWVGRALRD